MPCGVYTGTGAWYDVNNANLGDYEETLELTSVDATTINLKVYIYKGTKGEPWADADLEFKPDGSFTATLVNGPEFGSGFCVNKVCTVAFRPVEVNPEGAPFMNAFVNTLRFEGNTLKRYNMVSNSSDDGRIEFQRSTLTKP